MQAPEAVVKFFKHDGLEHQPRTLVSLHSGKGEFASYFEPSFESDACAAVVAARAAASQQPAARLAMTRRSPVSER